MFTKQVSATWNGCTYTLLVERERQTSYPPPDYMISLRSTADASGTCLATTASRSLGSSQAEPTLAIVAESAGLVVAYSTGGYFHGVGGEGTQVHRVDPITLGTLRSVWVNGSHTTDTCGAGGGGVARVAQLTIYNHAILAIQGPFGGNWLTVSGGQTVTLCTGPVRTLPNYTVLIPEFFTSQQTPILYTY
ncbi:hypothetical protein POL68_33335 [Stigmatella sp. ncwal1]|uniref:Uncharacterized protein n=1 Tax=Stigmatella ashevillensis TaxID=2995309 RepID=A0ABT5DIB1_9BACT|nr:hypothetical protein [Stigmatella ashevillena]MDC0713395.1 hypothetical protein [Stigmatella ashevillena]